MDFHNEYRLKNMPRTLMDLWQVSSSKSSSSSTRHYHTVRTEMHCCYKHAAYLIFQPGQRPTTTSEGISSPLIHATRSSTQVTTSVARTVDFHYQQKFNVEKSFTNKTSPFGVRLFNGWIFLLTLRSVRKPNLQYIICCCLVVRGD